ncbi:sigma 54-interacting transcriptional regulator [Bacillus luteus]|uniref:Sigma 54-interacting transcriptional regulator n=2 Tax=Alkalicoccus luteus TaxID=1237094 RepID=A0A969PVU1_9BACI|nr:sigma 54-interacting transcriptional regulator [Alkalicoccus luteus]
MEKMMQFQRRNGLHIRLAAAMISTLQQHVSSSDDLQHVWIEYGGRRAQIANLLAIVSLRIPSGASFRIYTEEPDADPLLDVIETFFAQEQEEEPDTMADELLIESSVSMEAAMAAMRHGVLVVNRENRITYVNEAAAALIGRAQAELHGSRADRSVPGSMMHRVLKTGEAQWNVKMKLHRTQIITNRAPVYYDGEIIGAVATFEDISNVESVSRELESVRLLKERLQLLLSAIQDAIVFLDEAGDSVYENTAFTKWQERETIEPRRLMKKEEWASLKRQLPVTRAIRTKDGDVYVMQADPVFLSGQFRGAVITLRASRGMRELLKGVPAVSRQQAESADELAFQSLVGESPALRNTIRAAMRASETDATVFISGESGTGKELLARGIHQAGRRRLKPFIAVNCASIPVTLLESELFGHEKGAFTSAFKTHIGAFEQADGGTLFLDEISELAPEVQSKLLRVIQEREITRVGGRERIPVDIRIITATNRAPDELITSDAFRDDLFYRLYVVPLHLPALRERGGDIRLLAANYIHYFSRLMEREDPHVDTSFLEALEKRSWPGNVRELQNVIERIMTLYPDDQLTAAHVPDAFTRKEEAPLTLAEAEREAVKRAAPYAASYSELGRMLGVSHKTAARKLHEHGLTELFGQSAQPSGHHDQILQKEQP